MNDPMANTSRAHVTDLPGYATPETVRELVGKPELWGWVDLLIHQYKDGHWLGRDPEGFLWIASDARLAPRRPVGHYVLLTGHADGIALYAPRATYHLIAPIEPDGEVQPDMPKWLPINVVLAEEPTKQ